MESTLSPKVELAENLEIIGKLSTWREIHQFSIQKLKSKIKFLKVGINSLANRLSEINGKIALAWLNLTFIKDGQWGTE